MTSDPLKSLKDAFICSAGVGVDTPNFTEDGGRVSVKFTGAAVALRGDNRTIKARVNGGSRRIGLAYSVLYARDMALGIRIIGPRVPQ
jgi:hypothetical protein